jgi:hypothetical protein
MRWYFLTRLLLVTPSVASLSKRQLRLVSDDWCVRPESCSRLRQWDMSLNLMRLCFYIICIFRLDYSFSNVGDFHSY